ncbi:excinuclease ABC subunit A, partial [Flavihumibacter sediminis]|nr:excinuclease ABC subunit A [Flavihumibacter sediminis]
SPVSGKRVRKDDVADVVDAIKKLKESAKVLVLVPFHLHANRSVPEELNILLQKGFSRLYDGELLRIEDLLDSFQEGGGKPWKPSPKKPVYLLVDRLVVKAFDEDDLHRI